MSDKNNSEKPMQQSDDSSVNKETFLVVGLGASAGGIKALERFFKLMPADSGMAFVVILHLSPHHESNLAALLSRQTKMPVMQVTEPVRIEPNRVYVIPPAKNLAMVEGYIRLTDTETERIKRAPIDLFFRTLGDVHGKDAVCVVLSGSGSDGTLGLKRVKEEGGITIVQDPSDAEYNAMPRSAIETGMADLILPIDEMPAKIISLKQSAERFQFHVDPPSKTEEKPLSEENALHEILALISIHTGHDFSNYKRPTLLRRIARRLQVRELENLPAYLEYLKEKPSEAQALLRDLLITVTNFFRDKEAFEFFEKEVVPKLFAGKSSSDQVRVWVAGCATGEESYSIAMLLSEHVMQMLNPPKIQIFASDIEGNAISEARECIYPETIEVDVSPERLQRFFIKEGHRYRVNKQLREMILFASHNLLRDPPFSKLDLVSCRNLLIYLNRATQSRALEIFHFALRPGGYLLLGASESAENANSLFAPVDKKHRIYTNCTSMQHIPSLPVIARPRVRTSETPDAGARTSSFGEFHHKLVEHYAPPSILVNEDYEIAHLSENAGRFLQFVGGEPSHNLLKAVRPELRLDLRTALFTAKQENRAAQSHPVLIRLEGKEQYFKLIVRPVLLEPPQGFLLVFFDEIKDIDATADVGQLMLGSAKNAMGPVARLLEEELNSAKEQLRMTIEQYEASNEELKASNVELQTINEELRSTTEELELSKEELQSVNEELSTVNHELKEKVEEVSRANSDLQNLMSSTEIGTIFLDRALCIKRYTPPVQKLFNIIPSDVGRPLEHLTHKLEYGNLTKDVDETLAHLQIIEREVRSADGRSYIVRLLPYRTTDDRIDGVIITFIDITERKRTEEELRSNKERLELAQAAGRIGAIEWNIQTGEMSWTETQEELYGLPAGEFSGKYEDWMKAIHPGDRERVNDEIMRSLTEKIQIKSEFRIVQPDGTIRWIANQGKAFYDQTGKPLRKIGVNIDITDLKTANEELIEADRRKDEFLATLSHELRNPLAPIRSGLEIVRSRKGNDPIMEKTQSMMERQFNQLVRLVDDLLDISRITHSKINLQKEIIDLRTIIDIAMETSRPLIESGGHALNVELPDEPIYINADLTRLAQSISNLLNNSVAYSEKPGRIWLSAVQSDDHVEIRVKDTGLGISEEMLPRIFDVFTQGDFFLPRMQGGLGIGLYLVKQLVELHGGTIAAESAGLGKGSEFIMRLPLAQEPLQKSDLRKLEAKGGKASANKPFRILVVDDNADTAEFLAILLQQNGHEARTVYDGPSAVEQAIQLQPEIVLLDIGMPGMDGYEVGKRIREKLKNVTLVAITGWGQKEDLRRTRKAGFDYHLVKPVEFEDIEKLLADIQK